MTSFFSLQLAAAGGPRQSLGLEQIPGNAGTIIKALLPVVGFVVLLPAVWLFFRGTWRTLDAEAADHQLARRGTASYDFRPLAVFAIAALILTLQEYYGGRDFYRYVIRPALRKAEIAELTAPGGWGQYVDTRRYGDLYGYSWWALTRVVGYTIVPLAAWKLLFRRDRLLDLGLRARGFVKHAWIYGVCLAVVLPCVVIAAQTPEFANYYPFYKKCTRSWFDLLLWESMYIAQFFALEVFFRGFMLVPLRKSMGSSAIFAMSVPYVMIHYGKPYLETCGAFVAGLFLGSLAMKTRSIYAGFLVHVTVALLMDFMALSIRWGFPTQFWPP